MSKKVRWGVLGAARIATEKVIPAMQRGEWSEVAAIASRDLGRARAAADRWRIPVAYGSYEELLADPTVEAIYNPLPNHLHVPWSIRALEAGKHVLCEKPLAMDAAEARLLVDAARRSGLLLEEAFMVRSHPQWITTREWIEAGRIGRLKAIQGAFSYFNRDPANVRNVLEYGGGGLMDIGCYPIATSRFILRREPVRVVGLMESDPDFGVDRLASGMMDFGEVISSFVCGTQLSPHQRMHFFGTEGRIEIEIPFNAPPDLPCRVLLGRGDLWGRDTESVNFPVCDQYTLQGDRFSKAVRGVDALPLEAADGIRNMEVIDAFRRSAQEGGWVIPGATT